MTVRKYRLPEGTCLRSLIAILFLSAAFNSRLAAQSLDEELCRVPTVELADQARTQGDAVRGAVVFFQHHMACSKCHSVGGSRPSALGPDLASLPKDVSDESLVESVLLPSKVIRKGFDSVTAVTADGQTVVGLLLERDQNQLVIRDTSRNGEQRTLATADLDEIVLNTQSIMPAGQVKQLASRQQFLDLIQYLREIRDGGAARARELQPSPSLLAFIVPDYEQHIDHAGFIRDWSDESLQRGEAIYRRVCMNCHGTREQPGSLPTSLRFAQGKFRSGSDPFTMYQTLTRGFGLMAAQTWMVPSQKYDVIHYIRESFLRPHNPSQLTVVDAGYLARLPVGDTRGPAPSLIEPWSAMDYGSSLTHTYEVPGETHNIAYKGIAIRLDPGAGGVSRGHHWMLFDTDTLRMAAAWSAPESTGPERNFIDWRGIQFNGEHQIHPRIVGEVVVANSTGPGWAHPASGQFVDEQRVLGRDGLRYGPLPREWAKFKGLYHHDGQVVLSYAVGDAQVLEMPGLIPAEESSLSSTFLRTFNIGPRTHDLMLRIDEQANAVFSSVGGKHEVVVRRIESPVAEDVPLFVGFAPASVPVKWTSEAGRLLLSISAGSEPLRFTVWTAEARSEFHESRTLGKSEELKSSSPGALQQEQLLPDAIITSADRDLHPLTHGGPPRWHAKITTELISGAETGPFGTDILTAPESNPWLAQTRFTGLDFFSDGRMAVCSWDGDVWIVDGIANGSQLTWQRIASGLFQPLGLKIVEGTIHLTCRDQLAVLHDLNGDQEIDFYECLNNDHQVTEHFHEFAMGLQTDVEGNFYYAKSGRHALAAIVPHHGTLLKVSRDGSSTEILAVGFRAANGVCLNPDGSFVVTDQEGFWNPKNRINWVTLDPGGRPKFYGNMFGYHDVTDTSDDAMEPPLCWITNAFDRSPGELLWVDSERWGPLNGSLLNLSYGYGKVFLVPHENVGGQMQGGMIELPIPIFPTGVMRGRFNRADGQLYLCGMFAWAGSATQPGGLYRLRTTGLPMHLPRQLLATRSGLKLVFTEPLDRQSISRGNIHVKTWSLKRTEKYGSDHYDERPLIIRGTSLSADGRTLTIDVADLKPTWCMEIRYALISADGQPTEGTIHNTIQEISK